MNKKYVTLPQKWSEYLVNKPETGMDYHVVSLTLKNGTKINDVAIVGCHIIGEIREVGIIEDESDIPFSPDEIVKIDITHRKWAFKR